MLSKLALQNIRGNKGYFIAYIITLSVFCTIVYQISNVQVSLDEIMNQGVKLKQFQLGEVFGYLKNFIYVIIAFFTFYIARFFIKRRTKEIALLKTLGLSRFNIFKVFVIENVVVIVAATILGLIMSFLTARLFTFLALSMIGIDIDNVGLSLLSKPVLDVCILMLINFIIISLIPIRTISKVSIAQLLQEDKKPDLGNKKPFADLVLFFIFLIIMIINAFYIIPRWSGEAGLIPLLLYLINASLLAVFLYKGLFINYFANYTAKHKGITNPRKIISYAHINQSSNSMYKIMSLISIITGMIIVLSIIIFGSLNTVVKQNSEQAEDTVPYAVLIKDQAKKQSAIDAMKKANLGNVISVDTYEYSNAKLKAEDSIFDDDFKAYEFKDRNVLLVKASDYRKAFKNAKKGNYLSNISTKNCGKDRALTTYCQLVRSQGISPVVDNNLSKLFNNQPNVYIDIKESAPNYLYPAYLVVNDNSPLLKNLKKASLVSYDQPIKREQLIAYSKLFFGKNTELKNIVHPYLEGQIMIPLILGSFQLTFFVFAIVLLIALMMSMFFRALESIELSLNDYIIAKRMGLTNKDINKSLMIEIFISQLLPFYFGIITSIILTRQLFQSSVFESFQFNNAISEPANLTFIIAILIVLHALVLILMLIIRYEINHIKKVK
jgi:hypothetical protein